MLAELRLTSALCRRNRGLHQPGHPLAPAHTASRHLEQGVSICLPLHPAQSSLCCCPSSAARQHMLWAHSSRSCRQILQCSQGRTKPCKAARLTLDACAAISRSWWCFSGSSSGLGAWSPSSCRCGKARRCGTAGCACAPQSLGCGQGTRLEHSNRFGASAGCTCMAFWLREQACCLQCLHADPLWRPKTLPPASQHHSLSLWLLSHPAVLHCAAASVLLEEEGGRLSLPAQMHLMHLSTST